MANLNPLASVLVSVKDDRRVFRLIKSLLNQTVPTDTFEIIVVENGSACLSEVANLGSGGVRYFHCNEANMAAARNLGLNAARGRYLLLTDADCVATDSWIEEMIKGLESGRAEVVGGAIRKLEPKSFTQRYGITIVDGQRQLSYLPALGLPYVAGANAGFITEKAMQVGGFDEAFRSGNDVDICYRLGLQGCIINILPNAIVLHEDRGSVREYYCRFREYGIYQVLLYAKYKHLSGKRLVLNSYPIQRTTCAVAVLPRALIQALLGDHKLLSTAFLQMVESIGIWSGDIHGSIRYIAAHN